MFAGQAALALANARRHRNEQRARPDLETRQLQPESRGILLTPAAATAATDS